MPPKEQVGRLPNRLDNAHRPLPTVCALSQNLSASPVLFAVEREPPTSIHACYSAMLSPGFSTTGSAEVSARTRAAQAWGSWRMMSKVS
jgi:hypothetical protein